MNIVARSDFNFQGFTFNPVTEGGAIWFTSSDLAKALGYKKTDAISQIYARNADEFSDSMSMTLSMRVNGINNSLRKKSVRIYSMRGAHLVGMLSETPVAKEFRRWVLDILDREVAQGNTHPAFDFEMAAHNARAINNNLKAIKELWCGGLDEALKLMEYKHRGDISDRLSYMTFFSSPLEDSLNKICKKGKVH